MKIILDESLTEGEHVPVEPGSGLWRGAGWFETLAVHGGEVYNPDPHLERLRESLPEPGRGDVRWESLRENLRRLAAGWSDRPGRLKIVAWEDSSRLRTAGWVRPYEPPTPREYRDGVSLEVERRSHPPRWPLTDEKRTSYEPALARRSGARGWGVLYCDREGNAWETAVANIVWLSDGKLHTPTPDGHLLPGTVLEALLRGCDDRGIPRRFSRCPWDEIGPHAWVCNSLVGILPVSKLGDRSLQPGHDTPVWNQLRDELHSDKVIPPWHDER